jgi:simple sugar transport system permease protein
VIPILADIGYGPFNMGWVAAAIVITTPILLAAVGELISERAGVLNVGLEGMMLVGAFASYWVTWKTGNTVVGALAGGMAGVVTAVTMGLIAIEAKADQIVTGVGINLVAAGVTAFGFDQIFGARPVIVVDRIGTIAIPGLSHLPGGIGPALFDHDWLAYLAFLMVPVSWYLLYRTKWGLAIRASGELPEAADTAGASVRRIRWLSVLTAGFFAGLGGSYLVLVSVGLFHQDMTAGRGFLALVAVIFGRWRPLGVLGAALVLGGIDALQIRLATVDTLASQVWIVLAIVLLAIPAFRLARRRRAFVGVGSGVVVGLAIVSAVMFIVTPRIALPDQLWRVMPYVLALVWLAGATTRARVPARLTVPYSRE